MVTQLEITDKRKEIAEQEIRDKRKDVKYITLEYPIEIIVQKAGNRDKIKVNKSSPS